MCGIVGYTGAQPVAPILLEGLSKLEYRGYDSAGMAILTPGGVNVVKTRGRLQVLSDKIDGGAKAPGTVGIGHTRWATHGEPSDVNSHPHLSGSGKIAIVHNGIIENYKALREFLTAQGARFLSQTDSEVIAQLMEHFYNGDMVATIAEVVRRVEGSYALGILCTESPETIYAVRKESPLIVGLGDGENFIASDVPAILRHTRDIYILEEHEIAVVTKSGVQIVDLDGQSVSKEITRITWDIDAAEKGGYEHFMFKEIMEQPRAIADTVGCHLSGGKVVLDELSLTPEQLAGLRKIFIVACGSAYHVGMVGKYLIEQATRIPVEVQLASEFRYSTPIVGDDTLVIIISQSGETADTLAALREAKRLGAHTFAIVNVVGSSIAREAHDVLYTRAGPEIAVATTKAYSTQLASVCLFALHVASALGRMKAGELDAVVLALQELPEKVQQILENKTDLQYLASRYYGNKNVFYIGRNADYALSLEGSLKLKEISYTHSEAYAAGELKHGTISLIEDGTLVVAISTITALYEKMVSNITEVKARGAVVMAVTPEDHHALESDVDHVIYIPGTHPMLLPLLSVIPLQLFAYYMASLKGCDIDKPRNLAKSVTVE